MKTEDQATRVDREREGDGQDLPQPASGSIGRRDALKALAAIFGAAGVTLTPVSAEDVTDPKAVGVPLAILTSDKGISLETAERLRDCWIAACEGTALAGCKAIVLGDGLKVEFVRGRTG